MGSEVADFLSSLSTAQQSVSIISAEARVVSTQLNTTALQSSGAAVTIAIPLTAEEKQQQEQGTFTPPSVSFVSSEKRSGNQNSSSSNSSVSTTVAFVAVVTLQNTLWNQNTNQSSSPPSTPASSPSSSPTSALSTVGQVQSSVVSIMISGIAVDHVDFTLPVTGSDLNSTASRKPVNYTIICPPGVTITRSYTCPDTGYMQTVECSGQAGKYKGVCPTLQQSCAALDLANMTVAKDNLCSTANTTTTSSGVSVFVCHCSLAGDPTTGTAQVAAGVVTQLVGSSIGQTFQASAAIGNGSAATKGQVILGLFCSIWGAAVLVTLYFAYPVYPSSNLFVGGTKQAMENTTGFHRSNSQNVNIDRNWIFRVYSALNFMSGSNVLRIKRTSLNSSPSDNGILDASRYEGAPAAMLSDEESQYKNGKQVVLGATVREPQVQFSMSDEVTEKLRKSSMNESGVQKTKLRENEENKRVQLLQYISSIFSPVYESCSLIEGLSKELYTKHQYIQLMFRLSASKTPVISIIKMVTLQSYLLCLLAVFYDMNYPSDDGSCVVHLAEDACLKRKYLLDSSQSYCRWSVLSFDDDYYVVDDDLAVAYSCIFVQAQFSYVTATYVSTIISISTIFFMYPLNAMLSLLACPTRSVEDSGKSQDRRRGGESERSAVSAITNQQSESYGELSQQAMSSKERKGEGYCAPSPSKPSHILVSGNNKLDVISLANDVIMQSNKSKRMIKGPVSFRQLPQTIEQRRKDTENYLKKKTLRKEEEEEDDDIEKCDMLTSQIFDIDQIALNSEGMSSIAVGHTIEPQATLEALCRDLAKQRNLFLTGSSSENIMLRAAFDEAWCLDSKTGVFINVPTQDHQHSGARLVMYSTSQSPWLTRKRSIVAPDFEAGDPLHAVVSPPSFISVQALVEQDIQEAYDLATIMQTELDELSDMHVGYEIMLQFVRDLLGRKTAAAKIFSMKVDMEYERVHYVSDWLKVMVYMALLGVNVFFFYFTLLRGVSKGIVWQRNYVWAWFLQLIFDVLLCETLNVTWFHYFIPILVKREIKDAESTLKEILEKQLTMDHKSCSYPLNAPQYLFASHHLARHYPRLLESQIVLAYRTHLPGELGKIWQREVAQAQQAKTVPVTRKEKRCEPLREDQERKHKHRIYVMYESLHSAARICCTFIIAMILQLVLIAPVNVQELVISLSGPVIFSALGLFLVWLVQYPIYFSILIVLVCAAIAKIVWNHFKQVSGGRVGVEQENNLEDRPVDNVELVESAADDEMRIGNHSVHEEVSDVSTTSTLHIPEDTERSVCEMKKGEPTEAEGGEMSFSSISLSDSEEHSTSEIRQGELTEEEGGEMSFSSISLSDSEELLEDLFLDEEFSESESSSDFSSESSASLTDIYRDEFLSSPSLPLRSTPSSSPVGRNDL